MIYETLHITPLLPAARIGFSILQHGNEAKHSPILDGAVAAMENGEDMKSKLHEDPERVILSPTSNY